MTPRLRTESEGVINVSSIITDGKIVGIRDTFSSSVLDVFTKISILRSQLIISEVHYELQIRGRGINRKFNDNLDIISIHMVNNVKELVNNII